METIISVVYRQRALQFEQGAYDAFQAYEKRLKLHFEKIDSGLEAFDDLQYRMAEILESQNKSKPLSMADIEQLIAQIGEPTDLEESDAVNNTEEAKMPPPPVADVPVAEKKWAFFRSKNEKMVGGVCAGLAHTFAIDPIAVRLIFVLVTLLQVATLFTINFGLIAYILLWAILPSKETVSQISRKLFRDPQYRILGGVCAGLAKFFSLQVWMIRVLFIAPFLLEMLNDKWFSDELSINDVSINGISFIVYVVLWMITPMAKNTTDYMLLNGAPVNLNTIQQAPAIERQQERATGGLTKLLRGLAYVVMGLLLLFLVPVVVSMGLGTFVAYRAADFLLFSTFHKSLAFLVIILVFILPLLALLIGIIRRMAGYTKATRGLRKSLLGLHLLGWFAGGLLVYSLLQQHHTISRKKTEFVYQPMGDTLRVLTTDKDSIISDDVLSISAPNNLIQLRGNEYRCKTVWVNFHRSTDSLIRVVVMRRATGASPLKAEQELSRFSITPKFEHGVLYLPLQFMLKKEPAYHFQHAQVDVYVPSKVVVRADRAFNLNQQRTINIGFSSNTFSEGFIDGFVDDSVIRMGDEIEAAISEELNIDKAIQLDSLRRKKQELKQEKAQALDSINKAIEALEKQK